MRLQVMGLSFALFFTAYSKNPISNFKELADNILPFRNDGKTEIPAHIKHIKLDIGLSYSAPISQYWLSH